MYFTNISSCVPRFLLVRKFIMPFIELPMVFLKAVAILLSNSIEVCQNVEIRQNDRSAAFRFPQLGILLRSPVCSGTINYDMTILCHILLPSSSHAMTFGQKSIETSGTRLGGALPHTWRILLLHRRATVASILLSAAFR